MSAAVFLAILSLALPMSFSRDFKPPDAAERLKAIGPTDGLEESLRKALDPGDDFQPIPAPKPMDWLASHSESGQTFEEFEKSKPRRPEGKRRKICLLPLGEFPEEKSPPLEGLKEYTALFFSLAVEVLPQEKIEGLELTTRKNPHTGNRQILTVSVLDHLRSRLPADAFALVAITMEDLYPEPSWNFVFGQAMPGARVGIYSFARYDPAFYGKERGKDYKKLIHHRSAKVLVHEIGHLFDMEHCIYFTCLMNGSNHLQESDSRPLRLCPVCLRKLKLSIGFDVLERYSGLEHYFRKWGFEEDARWMESRLLKLKSPRRP